MPSKSSRPRKKRKQQGSMECKKPLDQKECDDLSDAPDGITVVPEKHSEFIQWAMSRGVEIDRVTPAMLLGRGMGLQITKSVKKGSRLVFVPAKAMFKPNEQVLDDKSLNELSPQARLTVSALARREVLETWTMTWPTKEDIEQCMPLCWDPSLQGLLPQAAKQVLHRQQADFAADWAASQDWCKHNNHSHEDFRYFWLIVNSRSFHWKPGVTKGGGEYAMCPFLDYMNHGPTGSGCDVIQTSEGYEVYAERDYQPGTELLATYGAHSHDKLLIHYGFVPTTCPDPDDSIPLDPYLLPHIPETTKTQLQDTGYLAHYHLTPAENFSLCHRTEVAVRGVLLACNEWEYFVGSGEDLGEDATGRVRAWLAPVLREGARDAGVKAREVGESDVGDVVARGLVTERWGQICRALGGWVERFGGGDWSGAASEMEE